jgi:hypothetical protein
MLRSLLLAVGALLALFSAVSLLRADDPKPADAKPTDARPADAKPPLGVTIRSDRTWLRLGESAVVTVAVKNAAKAPEVTMPAQTDAAFQLLSGPELRPTILDGVEPQDWPVYRNSGKVPGQRIIEAMRTLTGGMPAGLLDGPRNRDADLPRGLREARAGMDDLRRNDWVFRYLVTPSAPGTFTLQSFAVKAADGQILKTDPITIRVGAAEDGSSGSPAPKKKSTKEIPAPPKEDRPR